MKPIINPSLMCMNFLELRQQLAVLNKRADLFHFDVMDGHFVPNITLSPDIAKAIAPVCELPLDIHLMVTQPEMYIQPFAKAVQPMTERGIISYFSPHAEVINGYGFRILSAIREAGFKPGVVINPETPLCMIEAYLSRLDKVTFMSVDPGFAGQAFIPEVLDKVRQAKRLKQEQPQKYRFIIEIDGSCNKNTYQLLADAGVESFIVGTSGLFGLDADLNRAFDLMMADMSQVVNGHFE